MHFSKTLATVAALALGAQAGFPVASIEFQSWEECPVGAPPHGEPKAKESVVATPVTCDKTVVNRDWSVDHYSFTAHLDTKDALLCSGVTVWNSEDCSGKPIYFLPFEGGPVAQGQCLPDILDPTYVSFKMSCFDGLGGVEGPGGPDGSGGDADGSDDGLF
ncbi:hypothetical protein N7509_007319 [Penicillium cosmopolitanum]|uniref:Uncharacterized protein n=1 Tax=Penicillium cosmopolitanum TaxID=1131564 RepID=A0A9W9VYS3_9EURO|nr:uncharacterized protein N7509_007319 [Penicillium cosmopolitanum]KAJ5391829.1 hypothetical protein N7509_007319 [Penicillium cosmopolitanum]